MPLFLPEYLKRPLSQDGSVRPWAAGGRAARLPQAPGGERAEAPASPAPTSPHAAVLPGAPTRPPAPGTGFLRPGPPPPEPGAARIPLRRSRRLEARASGHRARPGARRRLPSGTLPARWGRFSPVMKEEGGLPPSPPNKQPDECTRSTGGSAASVGNRRAETDRAGDANFPNFPLRPRGLDGAEATGAPAPRRLLRLFSCLFSLLRPRRGAGRGARRGEQGRGRGRGEGGRNGGERRTGRYCGRRCIHYRPLSPDQGPRFGGAAVSGRG